MKRVNRFRKTIPLVQPIIKDMLDIDLGDIQVEDSGKFYDLERKANPTDRSLIYRMQFLYPKIAGVLPKYPSIIWSGDDPDWRELIFPRMSATHWVSHEVGHLAHMKMVGPDHYMETPSNMREGFAETVARETMSRLYPGPVGKRIRPLLVSYDEESESFLKKAGIKKPGLDKTDWGRAIDFIKSCRESKTLQIK